MTELEAVLAQLESAHVRILDELIEFASIPSVSTDPAHVSDMRRAAQWVATAIRRAGPFDVRVISTDGASIVSAEWLQAPDAPTVLVYGHYDVQPADPVERWHTPPFEPSLRNGRIYGRGVSDDKGPLLIPIKVAEAFFSIAGGGLPLNVKFLIEGEEEIGSPHLEQALTEHRDRFAADAVLSADGAMWRIDEPSLTIASRGLAALEFTVGGPARDLHSGRHGGSVANPLHAIARMIASLHHPDGRVAVDGFYDGVRDLTPTERDEIAMLPFDEARYLEQVGAPAAVGEPGYTTLERQWTRPTIEVNGMWGGYQGPGRKTVVPSNAHAKVTCRLVPDQDPEAIARLVVRHLEGHLPPGVTVTFDRPTRGARPAIIARNHPMLDAAKSALEATYGVSPLMVRLGGTLPMAEMFQRVMGMDTVYFSFSTGDEDFHAPNEFFRIDRLHQGLAAWARLWHTFGTAAVR